MPKYLGTGRIQFVDIFLNMGQVIIAHSPAEARFEEMTTGLLRPFKVTLTPFWRQKLNTYTVSSLCDEMTDDESVDEKLALLSDSDLKSLLIRLQGSHSSSFQSILLLRRLLASVSSPAIVIGAIPKIIQCSSGEFAELYSSFASILVRDSFSAAPLLEVMGSFDYESDVKPPAHLLALNLLERIEADRLPVLVSQILFVAPANSIPDVSLRSTWIECSISRSTPVLVLPLAVLLVCAADSAVAAV
jgi:hypothetical protein